MKMGSMKRTYALPAEIVAQFEESVPPGRRSSILAKLIESWVAERRRAALAKAVVEGCREMADVYLTLERDFHPLEEEVAHATDEASPTR
jgi:hypothetical protein